MLERTNTSITSLYLYNDFSKWKQILLTKLAVSLGKICFTWILISTTYRDKTPASCFQPIPKCCEAYSCFCSLDLNVQCASLTMALYYVEVLVYLHVFYRFNMFHSSLLINTCICYKNCFSMLNFECFGLIQGVRKVTSFVTSYLEKLFYNVKLTKYFGKNRLVKLFRYQI